MCPYRTLIKLTGQRTFLQRRCREAQVPDQTVCFCMNLTQPKVTTSDNSVEVVFLKADLRVERISLSESLFFSSCKLYGIDFNIINCVVTVFRFSTVMRAACFVSFVQAIFVFVTFSRVLCCYKHYSPS